MKTRLKIPVSALLIFLLLLYSCNNSVNQVGGSLPRSTPEAEGVDSKGIIDFLAAAEKSSHEFHSFMLLRHGKVVAEGWWSPYAPSLKHTLYSLSKSFTSTAVGLTVTDNKLKLSDKVVSFFPGYLPDTLSSNLSEMEVKDLITMSAGMDPDPTFRVATIDTNWIKGFLATPVINEPGTKFLYNSLATYMLSAIVQKVTGEKVIDILTPRLFDPLGIEGADWEIDPMGINTGGWGLRLRTEDMAKFGQLYLQKGKWNGKQILPAEWVNEATTFKIDQAPGIADSIRSKSDWMQGYCYQFWRCRHNAFRGDGAYGQYVIVMPDKDAVIAITSETPDMQGELNLVWDYILPALKDNRLPAAEESDASLKQSLGALSVKLPEKGISSELESAVSDKTYLFGNNSLNVESVTLSFKGGECVLKMKENGKDYDLPFGSDNWVIAKTSRPGPNLLMTAKGYPSVLPPVEAAGIYRWREKDKLELTLRYIESPHTEVMNCTFKGDSLIMNRIEKYITPKIPVIRGKRTD